MSQGPSMVTKADDCILDLVVRYVCRALWTLLRVQAFCMFVRPKPSGSPSISSFRVSIAKQQSLGGLISLSPPTQAAPLIIDPGQSSLVRPLWSHEMLSFYCCHLLPNHRRPDRKAPWYAIFRRAVHRGGDGLIKCPEN